MLEHDNSKEQKVQEIKKEAVWSQGTHIEGIE